MGKSDLMDDCPLCSMISEGTIVTQGDHCCVLQWGKHRAAVLSTHNEDAGAEALIEAMKLLGFTSDDPKKPQNQILREFDLVAGHWGVKAVPAGEITSIGKSMGRES